MSSSKAHPAEPRNAESNDSVQSSRAVPGYPGVYAVGPDKYKLVVYAGLDELGRQRQRTKTFTATSERALKKAHARELAKINDSIAEQSATRDTIAGVVEAWVEYRKKRDSPSTYLGRRSQVKRITKDIGHLRLDSLTARKLDLWYGELEAGGMTASTIHAHYVILHAAINQWWKWGECSLAPLEALKRSSPPPARPRKPKPPTAQALKVLIDSAPPDLRLAALLAAGTGMRRGEIIGLRWSDIHGDVVEVTRAAVESEGGQTVKSTKTDDPRAIRIGSVLQAALAEHRVELARRCQQVRKVLSPDAPVLADVKREQSRVVTSPRRLGWLSQAWAKHAKKQGAPDVRFHDLRHWHATQLLNEGHDIATIQHRLGHSKPTTTLDVYSHSMEASDVRAAATIDGLLTLDIG